MDKYIGLDTTMKSWPKYVLIQIIKMILNYITNDINSLRSNLRVE